MTVMHMSSKSITVRAVYYVPEFVSIRVEPLSSKMLYGLFLIFPCIDRSQDVVK